MKYGILMDVHGSGKNAVADADGDKPSPSGFVCAYNVIEGKNLDYLFTTTTTRKPTTTTTTLIRPQVLIQKNIVPLAKSFYRTYSYPHIRHAYHHNWEYLKKLVARGYKYENVAGKVIPYADYKSNKNTIDRLCPDLAVFHENFETFGLGDQLYHNQFYYKTKYTNANHRSNGETLVAATTPGYCGATVPVYYVISKDGLAFGRGKLWLPS
ncbi:hypothetical protein QR680_015893 [Steinernema hermaphroditum]|uniref:Uncharacterized protein n=1 Tax=Steinernema hermaphroditum TaxID=289476 RepID=A0AA39LLN9_9BILA|nr:hypothetical protein QR680_015893 [Steinernema hermaphroditum]